MCCSVSSPPACRSGGMCIRHRVAVRCRVVQCAAEWAQCDAVRCNFLQFVAGCCSMLQYVAVCCSMLQCVAARPRRRRRSNGQWHDSFHAAGIWKRDSAGRSCRGVLAGGEGIMNEPCHVRNEICNEIAATHCNYAMQYCNTNDVR